MPEPVTPGSAAEQPEHSACCHSAAPQQVATRPPAEAGGEGYTCPMHPEVRSPVPGPCPICGMALEPLAPTATHDTGELDDMTRRFWVAVLLTLPLFVIAMSEMLPGLSIPANPWVQLLLAAPVVSWCGWPFLERGYRSVVARSPNMFTLIAAGTSVAFVYSLIAVVAPGVFPAAFRDAHGGIALYFEAAAVVVTLVLLGQVLELRARRRTGDALGALLNLTPPVARRVEEGSERDIALSEVRVGDLLRVRPGESVPVDGTLVEGSSAVDEAMLTGEAIAVAKQPGDALIGGTVNASGSFIMRAEHVGADTLLARIVRRVGEAQRSRAPIQAVADRVAAWLVPLVFVVALVSFAVWWAVGPSPAAAHGLISAVAVLIIACPCALGLATPVAIVVGMGRGARAGILIRNAEVVQRFESVDCVVVDKTGTLTEGRPAVVTVDPAESVSERDLLAWAGAVERASEHPLAEAIVRAAERSGAVRHDVTDFEARAGFGVRGTVAGIQVVVGNRRLMEDLGLDIGDHEARAEALRELAQSVVFVAAGDRFAGLLGVADPVRSTTPEGLRLLHARHIEVLMLTGDAPTTATAVARQLGIVNFEAGLLPEDKSRRIRELQAAGRVVAMAGDGINDAPALAQADVGLALGTGTDVAVESADITLVHGDLRAIAAALELSRSTMTNIRQNLFFAFVYNLVCVPVAAGVLYPFTGWLLSPMVAAAAMSLSSVSVIANALRLRQREI